MTPPLLLASIDLSLPQPWHTIGITLVSAHLLGLIIGIAILHAKLADRPSHKPAPTRRPLLPAPKS